MSQLAGFFPFINWFPLRANNVKADIIAGITIALVLVPLSMAYAQLAGLRPLITACMRPFCPASSQPCGAHQHNWPPARLQS